jgi:DNA (cytosine-5)-methyltransferase 1
MKKYTAIDLFSGCGGLTLGLKLAGFNVRAAIENDALAVQTYKANHPEVSVCHDDIRAVKAKTLRERLNLRVGELDLLAGCPRCQGFSALRTRNGAAQKRDHRNGLIREMLRFTRAFRPKAVMMENVPGLAEHWSFKKLCRDLRRLKCANCGNLSVGAIKTKLGGGSKRATLVECSSCSARDWSWQAHNALCQKCDCDLSTMLGK